MIILVTHATSINGKIGEAPTNVVRENLFKYSSKPILNVRHFIYGEKSSQYILYNSDGTIKKEGTLFVLSKFSILRYITEIFTTFFFIVLFVKSKNITYIGFNPLNSFVGYLLKKVKKIKKNIFYTPDYSPKRFNNSTLNSIYHKIDRVCVFGSDEVWNVSERIFDIRKKMGLETSKNIFIPNMPGVLTNEENKQNNFSLITAGNLRGQLDYLGFINSIAELKNDYPKICFYIAGEGPLRGELEECIEKKGLTKNVVLLGRLDYQEYLIFLEKCSIGIALYNGTFGFNYYGDSMKCREFTCYGMPIVTTKYHSTAAEIEKNKAGIIVLTDQEGETYTETIRELFDNYSLYSKNSKKLGELHHQYYIDKIKELG